MFAPVQHQSTCHPPLPCRPTPHQPPRSSPSLSCSKSKRAWPWSWGSGSSKLGVAAVYLKLAMAAMLSSMHRLRSVALSWGWTIVDLLTGGRQWSRWPWSKGGERKEDRGRGGVGTWWTMGVESVAWRRSTEDDGLDLLKKSMLLQRW